MNSKSVISCIKSIKREIFTTAEITLLTGKSQSTVVQSLNYLERQGLIFKVYRGIWAERDRSLHPFAVIPYLVNQGRAYVSFISALHFYGFIEQIPQTITVASISHTKTVVTKIATYAFHRIHPSFFKGFSWDERTKSFLIAEPEKALIDCLYLSAYKKKYFNSFPELDLMEGFSFKKAREWINELGNPAVKKYVARRLEELIFGGETS